MVDATHTDLLSYGARYDSSIEWMFDLYQSMALPVNRSHYNFAAGLVLCLPHAQVINAERCCGRVVSSQ